MQRDGVRCKLVASFHSQFPRNATGVGLEWLEFARNPAHSSVRTVDRFGSTPQWPEMRKELAQLMTVLHFHHEDALAGAIDPKSNMPHNLMYCRLLHLLPSDSRSDPFAGWRVKGEATIDLETWLRKQVLDQQNDQLGVGPSGIADVIGNHDPSYVKRLLEAAWSDAESRAADETPQIPPDQMTIVSGASGLELAKPPPPRAPSSKSARKPSCVDDVKPNAEDVRWISRAAISFKEPSPMPPICESTFLDRARREARTEWIRCDARINAFVGTSGGELRGWEAIPEESRDPEKAEAYLEREFRARWNLPDDSPELRVPNGWEEKFPGVKLRGKNGRVAVGLWQKYVSACWRYRGFNWLSWASTHPSLRRWSIRFSSDFRDVHFALVGYPACWFSIRPETPRQLVGFYHFLHFSGNREGERSGTQLWADWTTLLSSKGPGALGCFDVAWLSGVAVPPPETAGHQFSSSAGYWTYLDECARHAYSEIDPPSSSTVDPRKRRTENSFLDEEQEQLCDLFHRVWRTKFRLPRPKTKAPETCPGQDRQESAASSPRERRSFPGCKSLDQVLVELAKNWDPTGKTLEDALRCAPTRDPFNEPELTSLGVWKPISPASELESIRVFCEFDLDPWVLGSETDWLEPNATKSCWMDLKLLLENPKWRMKLVESGFDPMLALNLVPALASEKVPAWIDYEAYEEEVENQRGDSAPDFTPDELEAIRWRWFEILPSYPIRVSLIDASSFCPQGASDAFKMDPGSDERWSLD